LSNDLSAEKPVSILQRSRSRLKTAKKHDQSDDKTDSHDYPRLPIAHGPGELSRSRSRFNDESPTSEAFQRPRQQEADDTLDYDDQARGSADAPPVQPQLPERFNIEDSSDLTGDIKDVYDDETLDYSDQLYMEEYIEDSCEDMFQAVTGLDGLVNDAFTSYFTAQCFYQFPSGDDGPWTKEAAFLVIPGPWANSTCFWMDISTGECFRVDAETDTLTRDELIEHEAEVIAADAKEVASFLTHKVFGSTVPTAHCQMRAMSCTWVRKWKWTVINGKRVRVIKCRLCVRGGSSEAQAHEAFEYCIQTHTTTTCVALCPE
jgi:hypothetical protein